MLEECTMAEFQVDALAFHDRLSAYHAQSSVDASIPNCQPALCSTPYTDPDMNLSRVSSLKWTSPQAIWRRSFISESSVQRSEACIIYSRATGTDKKYRIWLSSTSWSGYCEMLKLEAIKMVKGDTSRRVRIAIFCCAINQP
jgi:hypothetical protein